MNKLFILLFIAIPCLARAQVNDLMILKKRGGNVYTYTLGSDLTMKTIYDQWLSGTITGLRNDTIYLDGRPFGIKEIRSIRRAHINFANTTLATGMMVAGGGIFVLGAVNGLYRGDKSKDWYTTSGLITGTSLAVVGFLLTLTRSKTYHIGRKFKLEYLQLGPSKPGGK